MLIEAKAPQFAPAKRATRSRRHDLNFQLI